VFVLLRRFSIDVCRFVGADWFYSLQSGDIEKKNNYLLWTKKKKKKKKKERKKKKKEKKKKKKKIYNMVVST